MTESTLLMIKPDAVQRALIGRIIIRIEEKGLKIIGLRMVKLTESEVDQLYDIHIGKAFYSILKSFILSGPVVAIAIQGNNAVKVVRKLAGITNSPEAEPGTIRGDFGLDLTKNIVHASDEVERARYELNVFFKDTDLVDYELINKNWIK
ncbi:MAG: nucleoside-diphosphate kinase [Candidatus Heimdallarchaeota archaeon]|nr:MAG: nucleoside-diphosphate kinase [Candidatus Heimdallarchaeota archaeon]